MVARCTRAMVVTITCPAWKYRLITAYGRSTRARVRLIARFRRLSLMESGWFPHRPVHGLVHGGCWFYAEIAFVAVDRFSWL